MVMAVCDYGMKTQRAMCENGDSYGNRNGKLYYWHRQRVLSVMAKSTCSCGVGNVRHWYWPRQHVVIAMVMASCGQGQLG